MKICFLVHSISASGGTERVCVAIANKLASLGYDITLLSFYGDEPFFKVDDNIQVRALYTRKLKFSLIAPLSLYKLRRTIKDIKPDFFVSVDAALFMYSYFAAFNIPLSHIVWEHFNFNVSTVKVRVLSRRLAAANASAIVVLTERDKKLWESNLNCKAAIIPINNPSPFFADKISLEKKNIVLSVGRLTYQKGFDLLLEAWKLVIANPIADWKLHIVGSGELKDDLEQQITKLGLRQSVSLIPATQHIQAHYKEASIYCMSSRYEGFPMVLLEAQAFGLPLISFDCETGPAEIISEGSNGHLVKDGDTEALAHSLWQLMTNPKERATMGKKSRESTHRYVIEVIIRKWIEIFDKSYKQSVF